MAILLVSKGTPVHGTGSLTPGAPAGIVVGNWLVAYFAEYQGADAQPTTPTNWTLLSNTTNHSGIILARVADGVNDAMPSINYGSATDEMAYCEQWSGLPSIISGNVTAAQSRVANLTNGAQSGALVPPVDGCLLLSFMCRNKTSISDTATWGSWTAGGGTFTQNATGAPNTNKLMWVAQSLIQGTKTNISVGSGPTSSPADSTAQSTVGYTIAIQPAAAASVPYPPTSLGGMNVQVCM